MQDIELQNRKLRQQLTELTQHASHNERIMRRFHERELELLSSETLAELFNCLTDGMKNSFSIEAISLILHDPNHELRHLLFNSGTPAEAFTDVWFIDDLEAEHSLLCKLKQPWLGPYLSPEHDKIFHFDASIQSVALLPIIRHQRIIGSLNLGSWNSRRFTRHHGSDFLHRLATIGGVCIENAANHERLLITGMTDALTGLHNRRYLDRRIKEEIARSIRHNQPLSCLFVDADHFKQINDNHGHAAGDAVLRELSSRIRSCLRASDLAIRYGGEEFALLLPQTSLQEAKLLGERIRLKIKSDPILTDKSLSLDVAVSIGVSEMPPVLGNKTAHENLGEQLLANADSALYQAKENGRNQVVCFKPYDDRLTVNS